MVPYRLKSNFFQQSKYRENTKVGRSRKKKLDSMQQMRRTKTGEIIATMQIYQKLHSRKMKIKTETSEI